MKPLERDEIENLRLEAEGKVPLFPFERNDILVKLNRLESLRKLKETYNNICGMIMSREDVISSPPRNPREDIIQLNRKRSLDIMKRQKTRMEKRIELLEIQIQKDIEESKNTQTQKEETYDKQRLCEEIT